MNEITNKPRNREIDLLRFVAALAVLLFHYAYAFPHFDSSFPYHYSIGRLLRYNFLAVDLFFIISGYVIMLTVPGKTAGQFIRSRAIRLYPVYWISCFVTFGLLAVGSALSSHVQPATVGHLLVNLTMFQEFFGYPCINSVYWTLTYELSFYILILLIICCNGWNYLLYILTAWLAYTFIAGPAAHDNYFSAVLIPKYSADFIAGMLFSLIRRKKFTSWKLYGLLGLSFIAIIREVRQFVTILEAQYHDNFNFILVVALVAAIFIFLWWITVYKPDFSRFSFFSTLGNLTYPLYLLHMSTAVLFYFAGNKVNNYIMLLVVTTITLLLAWLVQKAEERTVQLWRSGSFRPRLKRTLTVSKTNETFRR